MTSDQPAGRSRLAASCLVGCAVMLVVFAALSWKAVSTKSPVWDEPLHILGASATRYLGDFRANYEDPPLWHYWAAIPQSDAAADLNLASSSWPEALQNTAARFQWIDETFNRPEGHWMDRMRRSRAMMLIIGVLLGAAIGTAAWRFGGPVAALVAVGFYSLDPNFLGHAPLIKNDVSSALMFVLVAIAVDAVGRRASSCTILLLALACGAAISTKFSGVLAGPIVVLALLLRAVLPMEWSIRGSLRRYAGDRVRSALGISVTACVLAMVVVWGCYRFRFAATPAGQEVNIQDPLLRAAESDMRSRDPEMTPTRLDYETWQPTPMIRLMLLPYQKHLMPQAWSAGLVFTYGASLYRGTYLLGETSRTGWWYYFPLAILFKTPTATLTAGALALVAAIYLAVARRKTLGASHLWKVAVLLVPVLVYGAASLTTNLNLGVRHVFPISALFYIALGWVASRLIAQGKRTAIATGAIALLLFAGVAVETVRAFPNYIAFFNTPSGGYRGGFYLLSDTNIDWGQDLPALAQWQKENPGERLYLSYHGTVDPALYGIRYETVPGGFARPGAETTDWPSEPGVLAVSVTKMHGQYFGVAAAREYYHKLTQGKPIAVLGGSIYLFRYPPSEMPSVTATSIAPSRSQATLNHE